jgi:type IV pilus assembly protein PilA
MKKTNKGFSLVELIIVIAIMAILIGVLAPQYIKYVEKSRKSADEDNADNVKNAVMTACTDDQYIDGISDGDTVTFSASGVTQTVGGTSIETALDEFFANWSDPSVKVKSKAYQGSTYTVTVTDTTGTGTLSCTGSW